MPTSCCVPGCRSNYGSSGSVNVFMFPDNHELRQQWLRAIRRADFAPTKRSVVCIKHFEEHCVIRENSAIRPDGSVLTLKRGRLKLTPDAVPSVFDNHPAYVNSSRPMPRKYPARKRETQKRENNSDRLPKDPEQRAKWVKAIGRKDWEPTVHATLCSNHFPESDLDRTSLSCVRLREGVVPSIFSGVERVLEEPDMENDKTSIETPNENVETRTISFEELIRKRGKYQRELTEVLLELIKIRKDRKRLKQIKRRLGSKVESLENLLLSNDTSAVRTPREELEMELEDAHRRMISTEEEIVTSNESKDALVLRKTDIECKLKHLPVPLKFKHDVITYPPKEPKPAAAGSSKRPASDSGDGGKKQKGRPKKMKMAEDKATERDAPEDCLQDPFEMIEIEETRIKEEVFETEEFNEIKSEEILPNEGSTQENVGFETIYCTPAIIKEECADDVETPDIYDTAETDTLIPEFTHTVIKAEPPEEDESASEEPVSRDSPPPLMWRCPLISCPEMFGAELEMYQHLNLNHVVKGLALSSKSKKVLIPGPVESTVISPSTSPSVAISGASGLVFFTSASSPRVSPVTVSSISVPVTTCQSVPSSSSGPVAVTTTFSYVASSAPVTSVSGSSVSSVSSASLIISASPSITVRQTPAGSSSCPPASLPVLGETTTPDCSVLPRVGVTSSTINSPNALPAATASQGLQKLMVAPISSQAAGPKQFLLLAPQQPQPVSTTATSQSQQQQISGAKPSQSQPQQISATKTSQTQALQIFHPSEPTAEDLPPCATDDSEMFSVSLARFPQDKRIPIKRKLIDVVDCFKQKNISPEKLLIAYYQNSSDSRTV